jgi:hypothetical protein
MVERSELEKAARVFHVTLDGQPFTVRVKSILGAVEYRKSLGRLVQSALAAVRDSGQLDGILRSLKKSAAAESEAPEGTDMIGQLIDAGVAQVLPELGTFLISDGLTLLVECLNAYTPELKDAIAKAEDEEIVAAAREVLRVTFPLVRTILATVFRVAAVAAQSE